MSSSSSRVEQVKMSEKDQDQSPSGQLAPQTSNQQPGATGQDVALAVPVSFERQDQTSSQVLRPGKMSEARSNQQPGATGQAVAEADPVSVESELEQDLQEAVDSIFANQRHLGDLKFSLTIADPMLDGCPLIGCSSGFSTLCGYEMQEIVGRNCRFLVDPVPSEQVDQKTRDRARQFCQSVKDGQGDSVTFPPLESWMPPAVAGEIFCAQTNARKNGSIFSNMFYLVAVELDGHPYILGLHTELKHDSAYREMCAKACKLLSQNRGEVDRLLASKSLFSGPVRRQDEIGDVDDLKPM